jgi:hypothetical protein
MGDSAKTDDQPGRLGHVAATLPQIVDILAILASLEKQAIFEVTSR